MTEQDLAGKRAARHRRRERHRPRLRARVRRARRARRHRRPQRGAAAEAAAAEVGGEAWVVDLADTAALDDLTLDVDILVNNAGIQRVSPIEEFDPDAFRLILRLMLESPFLLIRAALPGDVRARLGPHHQHLERARAARERVQVGVRRGEARARRGSRR